MKQKELVVHYVVFPRSAGKELVRDLFSPNALLHFDLQLPKEDTYAQTLCIQQTASKPLRGDNWYVSK